MTIRIAPTLRTYSRALAGLVVLLVSPAIAGAQDAPTGDSVAASVQSFYDQTRSMRAHFTQRYHNRVYNRTDTSRGEVLFKKPGMMRFNYANGKIVAADGTRFVVYEPPGQGERVGQYYEQQMSQAQLPAAFGFLTGTGELAPNYTFRLLQGTANFHVLEMRPRRPTPHYSRITLYVDTGARSAALRGVVHRIIIIDAANNTNRFDFTQQQYNRPVASSEFRYTPPTGARRVQP